MTQAHNPFWEGQDKFQPVRTRGCSHPNETLGALLFVASQSAVLTALGKSWGKKAFTDPQKLAVTLGVMLFVGLAVVAATWYLKRESVLLRRHEASQAVTHQEKNLIGGIGGNVVEMNRMGSSKT